MLRIDINLIFTVIDVLILFVAVRIFLWNPIHKILAQRQELVEKDFKEAEQAKADAEAAAAEQKSLMANIEETKAAAVKEATAKAQEESNHIIESAKTRADDIVKDAEAEALNRKEAILRETQNEITEIIVSATAKVSGVASKDQSDLYDAFLEKAGKSE